jgi:hypothetical protein
MFLKMLADFQRTTQRTKEENLKSSIRVKFHENQANGSKIGGGGGQREHGVNISLLSIHNNAK